MNRRDMMIAAGTTLGAALLPIPGWALPALSSIADWGPGTLENRHAPMIARWITDLREAKVIYATDELGLFDRSVKLENPRFRVLMSKRVWNWMTGYTDEKAPLISICEGDVHLGNVGIATSGGYEQYFSAGKARNRVHHPDYFVRRLHLPYDNFTLVEEQLPKDHCGMDTRWFEHFQKQEKTV